MWKVVQAQPSAARFPDGEALAEVSSRAVDRGAGLGRPARRRGAIWLPCSHGDVIKAILADALGLHLDQFQRIVVDPCSVSVVRYTATRPYVLLTNDIGGDLAAFGAPVKRRRGRRQQHDAAVGGGAGAAAT